MLRNLKSYMIKKTLKWTVALLLVSVLTLVVFSNYQILHETKNYTFSKASEIKKNRVGLVLGTSKYYKGGGLNLYFKNRIEDRKSTRLNSSHVRISYAVFCLKKK